MGSTLANHQPLKPNALHLDPSYGIPHGAALMSVLTELGSSGLAHPEP